MLIPIHKNIISILTKLPIYEKTKLFKAIYGSGDIYAAELLCGVFTSWKV